MNCLARKLSVVVALWLLLSVPAVAGEVDSPAPPGDPVSYMGSMAELCSLLDTGAVPGAAPGSFVEPAAGPGATGCPLAEAMAKAPLPDNVNGAAPGDVAAGKTYWGLRTDGTWGNQTGTGTGTPCVGGSSPLGRWCNHGNGMVTDTTTGLIWLRDASWGGRHDWWEAHTRAGELYAGELLYAPSVVPLNDGSVAGDWRLPTLPELEGLANGVEAVRTSSPQLFAGVQSYYYRTSTSYEDNPDIAWIVHLGGGNANVDELNFTYYVWPVRGGQ